MHSRLLSLARPKFLVALKVQPMRDAGCGNVRHEDCKTIGRAPALRISLGFMSVIRY